MKLSEYAKQNSICYKTAWLHFKEGKIPNARQLPSGTVVIDEETQTDKDYTVIYARVSSSKNKDNLDKQAQRLLDFCNANGWIVNEVVKECASGLNDERPKLMKILQNKQITRLVIEHKDRLTRFGFNYIQTMFPGNIIIVNPCEDKQDLFEDFISLVTSFCARIYGRRRSKRRTEQIIKGLQVDD